MKWKKLEHLRNDPYRDIFVGVFYRKKLLGYWRTLSTPSEMAPYRNLTHYMEIPKQLIKGFKL